jgi:hypothetical protein
MLSASIQLDHIISTYRYCGIDAIDGTKHILGSPVVQARQCDEYAKYACDAETYLDHVAVGLCT